MSLGFFATQVKRKAWAGEYQMLYITPELATNNTAALQQLHATRRIGLIAIDEAHCVSEWCVLNQCISVACVTYIVAAKQRTIAG
jgi:hypothetical protein